MSELFHSAHRFALFSVADYIFSFEWGLFQQQKSPFSVGCHLLLLLLFVGLLVVVVFSSCCFVCFGCV